MNILHDSSALSYSLLLMFMQNSYLYQLAGPYSRLYLLKLKKVTESLRGEL